jgi:hypothetical protein
MKMDAGQLKGRIFRIFGLFVGQSVLGFKITETNIGKTLPYIRMALFWSTLV